MSKLVKALAISILVIGCFAGPALAAEGGHGFDWTNFILRVINIALFVGVLYWLLAKRLKAFLSARQGRINNNIETIKTRKADAQARIAEVEKRVADLDRERESILAEYRAQGEAMRRSIIEKAEIAAEQIRAQAKVSAEQEAKQTRDRILAEAADQVVRQARSMLQEQLTKEKHEELIDKYLNRVVLN